MHKAKTKSHEGRVDWLFYLIQFHSLRLEAAHVDGKVVVLLLYQLQPKKHKMPPISMCLREAISRIPAGFVPSSCLKLVLWPPQAADGPQVEPLHFHNAISTCSFSLSARSHVSVQA